ncbi:cucumber peeling cupredoxin-like [Cucumis sativus]|uniref:Phytocyanin domain-containing protein n=1 Tax=Cucumis sativus TaxID=3659 RepID=A0A0A0KAM8_CUCSA|nr:cucumber peeling cupredoxin-like [Cucumis sativus]KGN45894.1 hypothetical protein Csa_005641 [Cucumis sativus]
MSTTTISSFAFFFLLLGVLLHVGVAVEHKVGGNFGWNLPSTPTFFSDWASNRTFFVDDKLIFESRSNEVHSIGQPISQADFDGCVNPSFVFRKVQFISLSQPMRRYFMSTFGDDCEAGMKFAINILPKPRNSAAKVGAWPMLLFSIATIMANLFMF